MFSSTIPQPAVSSKLSYTINCPEQSIQKRNLSVSCTQPVSPHPTNSPEMFTFSSILSQPAASNPLSHPINCPEQFISERYSFSQLQPKRNLLPGFNRTQHRSWREFLRGFSGCHMPTDRQTDRWTYKCGYGKRCSSTLFVVNVPISILNGNLRQIWSAVKNVYTIRPSPNNTQRYHNNVLTHRASLCRHTLRLVSLTMPRNETNSVWRHYTTSTVC